MLRMKLLGANTNSPIEGLEEFSGQSNYFIGKDPKQWHTGVARYAKVQSHEVSRYKDMGGLGVIAKPFDPMTLADSVRALWGQNHAGGQ